MRTCTLLQTNIRLGHLRGELVPKATHWVVKTPNNPDFYFGNLLILAEPPSTLAPWVQTFEDEFGQTSQHCCLEWSGPGPGESIQLQARELGMTLASVQEMLLNAPPAAHDEWFVRALEFPRDWAAYEALSIACDPTESSSDATYRSFKSNLRAGYRQWVESGQASWWGAFDGERLIGQCGLVPCEGIGRLQAVETHPDWRRRGVCSSLISTLARSAVHSGGLHGLVLAAEVDGPALALYRSLGFTLGAQTHSVLRSNSSLVVRDEEKADHATVQSLVRAAFGGNGEADLVAALRNSPGVLSLVASQAGAVHGHILFSALRIAGEGSKLRPVALAPVAVRPHAQGRGVGLRLIEAGLQRCREAGFELCILIGSAAYYTRFGFEPATPHGLRNGFGVSGEPFMVLALRPGALEACAGDVIYDKAFAEL